MNVPGEEALFGLALEKPAEKCATLLVQYVRVMRRCVIGWKLCSAHMNSERRFSPQIPAPHFGRTSYTSPQLKVRASQSSALRRTTLSAKS